MSRRNDAKFLELVEVVASGRQTIKDWCQANGVKYQTAREWSRSDEFRSLVSEIHQSALSEYLGKLTVAAGEVAEEMLALMRTGERKDVIKLQACRGIVADLMAVGEIVSRDEQIAELRERIAKLEGARDAAQLSIEAKTS
jgi:hypothetical protein